MRNKNQFWFSVVFLFFLITLVLSFWVIVLNKQLFFEKKIESSKIQDILLKNIITQWNISLNYNTQNNANGGNYKPFLSCPWVVDYYSWNTIISSGSTSYSSGNCEGILNSLPLKLYFNNSKTAFLNWELDNQWFTLTGGTYLSGELSSTTAINFAKPTLFDTRFIKARIELNGILFRNSWYQNVFWDNKDSRKVINQNTNNTWSFSKITEVGSGFIYLDMNAAANGKIVEFNRNMYNNDGKLLKIYEFEFSSPWGAIGYIQNDGSILPSTANAKTFDFINKDYAVFLSYESGALDNMRYKLQVYDTQTGKFSYINPIKDDSWELEYMWTNILMDNWEFYSKVYKITDYKSEILNSPYPNCMAAWSIPCIIN